MLTSINEAYRMYFDAGRCDLALLISMQKTCTIEVTSFEILLMLANELSFSEETTQLIKECFYEAKKTGSYLVLLPKNVFQAN